MPRDWVVRIVDASSRRPRLVLLVTAVLMVALAGYASRLELRSDLLELLPRDSPRLRALEHQLGRVSGGTTLIVIVSSPDRAKNERLIDDLASTIRAMRESCADRTDCPARAVSYVESSTADVRAFYERNKWLYADAEDLRRADAELDREIALRSGLVEDLDAPEAGQAGAAPERALGAAKYVDRWRSVVRERDAFPSGHFATPD
jgi:predicted RND superfamily exporter protein